MLLIGKEEIEELLRGKVEGVDNNAAIKPKDQPEVPEINLNSMEGQYHPSTL